MREAMPLLKLEHVTKRFGGLVAVDDVSLEVKHGEIIAIVIGFLLFIIPGIILLIVLLLFGGAKLPKLARSLGQAQKEFRMGMDEANKPVSSQPAASQPFPPPTVPIAPPADPVGGVSPCHAGG